MSRPHPRARQGSTPQTDADRSLQFQLESLQPRILLSASPAIEADSVTLDYTPVVDAGFAVGEPAPDGSSDDVRSPDAAGDEVFTTQVLIDDSGDAEPDGIFYTLGADVELGDPAVEDPNVIFYTFGGGPADEAVEIPVDAEGETDIQGPDCVFTLEEEVVNLEDPIFFQVEDDVTGTDADLPPDGIFYMRPPEEGETLEDLAAVQTLSLLEESPVAVSAPAGPAADDGEVASDNLVAAPPTASQVDGAIANPLLSKPEEILTTSGSVLA